MIKAGSNSQFINYAKHWFMQSHRYYDLAILVSDYCMMDVQNVTLEDIRSKLIHVITDLGLLSDERHINLFFEAIAPSAYYRWALPGEDDVALQHMFRDHPNYNYNKAVISACLSVIATAKVFDNGETLILIDEPDYSLIPKREPFPSEENNATRHP